MLYGQWNRGGCSPSLLREGPGKNVGAALAGVTQASVQVMDKTPC